MKTNLFKFFFILCILLLNNSNLKYYIWNKNSFEIYKS